MFFLSALRDFASETHFAPELTLCQRNNVMSTKSSLCQGNIDFDINIKRSGNFYIGIDIKKNGENIEILPSEKNTSAL